MDAQLCISVVGCGGIARAHLDAMQVLPARPVVTVDVDADRTGQYAEAWQFYVLGTTQIERELGDQKSVGLRRLEGMCAPVRYETLQTRVDAVLKEQ